MKDTDLIVNDQTNEITNDQESERFLYNITHEFEKKIATDRSSTLTILGIFSSIVTFVSIEIQILQNICDFWRLLGFSFYVLGALLSFIFILQYISKSWIENDKVIKIKELFTIKDFGEKEINPSVLISFCVMLSLFLVGFIAMNRATDEYTCKVLHLNKELDLLESKLEENLYLRISGELSESIEKRIQEQQNANPQTNPQ